jgi:4-azaleucine resistance transporter AzlC
LRTATHRKADLSTPLGKVAIGPDPELVVPTLGLVIDNGYLGKSGQLDCSLNSAIQHARDYVAATFSNDLGHRTGTTIRMCTQENWHRQFWSGAREISPLALGAAIYGLAFGLLAAQAHFGALQVGVMGGIVFAGGSQIVATERLVAGAGAFAAAVAGIALNLRLLLITGSIRDVFAGRPWWQLAIGAHVTTDENWALMLAERAKGRDVGYWYLVGGGICLLIVWCLATVIGILFATAIPEPKALGMDFAFTAAFIAIARSLWRGRGDLVPWLVAVLVVAVSTASGAIGASWALILGGLAGAGTAGVIAND